MAINYTVILYNSAGTKQLYSDGFLDITMSRAVNGIDLLRMVYGGDNVAVQYLTYGSIIVTGKQIGRAHV